MKFHLENRPCLLSLGPYLGGGGWIELCSQCVCGGGSKEGRGMCQDRLLYSYLFLLIHTFLLLNIFKCFVPFHKIYPPTPPPPLVCLAPRVSVCRKQCLCMAAALQRVVVPDDKGPDVCPAA